MQLTLFTVEGLVLYLLRRHIEPSTAPETLVHQAYLRWLATQPGGDSDGLLRRFGTCSLLDGQLSMHSDFCRPGDPDPAVLSALSADRLGTPSAPINRLRSGDGLPRVAPAGLVLPAETVFAAAARMAALIHGDPVVHHAAGCCAVVVRQLTDGKPLAAAIDAASASLDRRVGQSRCLEALQPAVTLLNGSADFDEAAAAFGAGGRADRTLGAGVLCAAVASTDFFAAMKLAVGLAAAVPGCAAVTGQIMGTLLGGEAVETAMGTGLAFRELIVELADDLVAACQQRTAGD